MEAYKERMVNEHKELQRRTVKLGELLNNYRQGKLDFELNCPVTLLEQQFGAMCVYLVVLERRAEIEGIELWLKMLSTSNLSLTCIELERGN